MWRGKTYSLTAHFWLFVVLPNVISNAVAMLIMATNLTLGPEREQLAWLMLAAVVIPTNIISYVGLINCARHRRWRGNSIVAVIITTIGVLYGIARVHVSHERHCQRDFVA